MNNKNPRFARIGGFVLPIINPIRFRIMHNEITLTNVIDGKYRPMKIATIIKRPALAFALFLSYSLNAQTTSDDKNFVRLSYQGQTSEGILSYMTFHDHDPRFGTLPYHQHHYYNPFWQATEIFHAFEVSGQYHLNSRTFINLRLPYQKAVRHSPDDVLEPKTSESGLGDLWLGGGYELYRTDLFKPQSRINHIVSLEAGIKIPVGKYARFDEVDNDIEPHFMPGTGSADFRLQSNYHLYFGRFLAAARLGYRLNTRNKFGFEYGNQAKVGLLFAYHQPIGTMWRFVPSVGVSYQHRQADLMDDKPIPEDTGGQLYELKTGLAIARKGVELGLDAAIPLKFKPIGLQPMSKHTFAIRLEYQFVRKQPVFKVPEGK